jgi:hypothetical protein
MVYDFTDYSYGLGSVISVSYVLAGFCYPRSLLSLLLVCRQTYAETKLVPFSVNDFVGESVLQEALGQLLTWEQEDAIGKCRVLLQQRQGMGRWGILYVIE